MVRNATDVDGDEDNAHEILEENSYYPFGMKHKGYNNLITSTNSALNYKYNGTELNESLGLNLYEMPLRSYDPAIARWTGIDPMTFHSQSTYTGMDNNPIFWADPSGAAVEQVAGGVRYTGAHAQAAFGALKKQYGGSNKSDENVTVLPEVFVTSRKGDLAGNILSRVGAAGRTANNIYSTKWYDRNYGGDGSGSFHDNTMYTLDQINNYNPIALLWDNISYSSSGTDRLGNPMTLGQANMNSLSIAPIGKAGSLFRGGRTVLGADGRTLRNAAKMVSEKGVHQLLVHGHYDHFIINGSITSPKKVARSLLSGGFRKGTPIRCVSCHTGKFPDGAAYQLSRYLKSPVLAPTDKVRILENGAYEIFGDGVWKQF